MPLIRTAVHACVRVPACCVWRVRARFVCARIACASHVRSGVLCVLCCVCPCRRLDGQTLVEIGAGYGTAPPPTSARLPPGTVTLPLHAGTRTLALAPASASHRVLSIDKTCSVQRAGAPMRTSTRGALSPQRASRAGSDAREQQTTAAVSPAAAPSTAAGERARRASDAACPRRGPEWATS